MPRKVKVLEEIEVITPETEVVKDKGIYKLKEEVFLNGTSRCVCGKLLGSGREYDICPMCGKAR